MSDLRTDKLDLEGRARSVELEGADIEDLAWHGDLDDAIRSVMLFQEGDR